METLGEACARTGWQVHAYCLMSNHFHAVIETPQANLVAGMKWFLALTQGDSIVGTSTLAIFSASFTRR